MCGWWRTDVIDISPTDDKTGSDFSCVRIVILIESTITWYLPQIVTCVPVHTFFPRKLLINSSWEASCHVNLTFCASELELRKPESRERKCGTGWEGTLQRKRKDHSLYLQTRWIETGSLISVHTLVCVYIGCVGGMECWEGSTYSSTPHT